MGAGRPRKPISELSPGSLRHKGRLAGRIADAKVHGEPSPPLLRDGPPAGRFAIAAPEYLRPETRKWYQAITRRYVLKPQHLKLLLAAAESLDLITQCREILAREGLTFLDRFQQPTARPEVAILRDSKQAFGRLLGELNLPGDPALPLKPKRTYFDQFK